MRIIELEEIRLLKQSEKCTVLLVRETDGEQLFVKKILQGRHEIYGTLQSCPYPYLPKIHEAEISDDTTVVLEEYIDGQVLGSATLIENQTCNIIKELCVVLQFIHEKGIIHRDINPSNIILAKDGHIRLIDFDAARMIKGDSEQDTRLLGTLGYAPPEQFGFAETDTRADIYALGKTMEQLLGEKAKKSKYQRIIRKCKMFDPDKRYQSVKAVKNAFSFRRRGLAYISAVMLAVFLSFGISHMIQQGYDSPVNDARESYPDESLLFYAKNGEYIIAGSGIAGDNPYNFVNLKVDMTGKGNYSDFSIPYSLNNWVEYGSTDFDLGFYVDPLSDELAPSFWDDGIQVSLWPRSSEEALLSIPYNADGVAEILTQITCADADGDGIYELFVSQGDGQHTLYTTVWRLADIENKHYEFAGETWGTSAMYLYSGGDIRAIINGDQLNHYNYADGNIKTISGVDYEAFKNEQRLEAEAAELDEAYQVEHYGVTVDEDGNWSIPEGWTMEDIARGYILK